MEGVIEGYDQPQGLLDVGITHAYIHEGALGEWAVTSEQAATEMLWFMGAIKLSRIVGNILGPGGDIQRAWDEDTTSLEAATRTLLAADERRYINPLLRHAAVAIITMDMDSSTDTSSPIRERLIPIGGPLVASCFDQGYHTYAFSEEGEAKMRRDSGPMAALTAQMGVGDGPPDLAIVHGSNGPAMRNNESIYAFNADTLTQGKRTCGDYLVPVELGVGADGTTTYVEQQPPQGQLSLQDVLRIDKTTRDGITQIANVRIGMVYNMIDAQRNTIGQTRHMGRTEQIRHLENEVARVIGRHRLIREQFYPATTS